MLGVQLLPEDVYYITGLPTDLQAHDVATIACVALAMAFVALYPAGARHAPRRRRHCAMSEAMDDVIRAERLGKTYAEGSLRTPVFDGLEFRVAAGGPSPSLGVGARAKSTLLHLLGGLDVPTAARSSSPAIG